MNDRFSRADSRLRCGAALVAALSLMLGAATADAAVVNSLRGFARDEPGWSGSVSGSFGASGGNTRETTYEAAGRLQWRGAVNTWRLIGSGKRTTSRGEETARSTLGHLRHNRELADRWFSLAFLQIQKNPFQRLDSRFLAGVGVRWDTVKRDKFIWAFGASTMYEDERINNVAGHETAHRLSTFSTIETELREGVTLDALLFYQPQWSDFGDWRVFGQAKLEVELTGSLSLFTSYQIEHDSRPPAGVEQTDWDTKTGFLMKF
jgi:putative salt-induced outer membrane protein YdiY